MIWKETRQDPLWGAIPVYRFPFLAWILREARYRLIFEPRIRIAYWWRLICG